MLDKPRKKKKWWILPLVLVILAAAGGGAWYYFGDTGADPVNVYPFNYLGMTEYWGDNQESYGPVSADKMQTVFLSDTQTVVEILVEPGDEVSKGDVLLRFDTSLTDLALERKRLDVEKLKLQLEQAKKRLAEIKSMKPMVIPEVDPEAGENEESLGPLLEQPYQISAQAYYDGSSTEKAIICWLRSDKTIDEGLLEAVRQQAEIYQNENARYPEGALPDNEGDMAPPRSEGEAPQTPEAPDAPQEDGTYAPFTVDHYYMVIKVAQGNRPLGQKVTWQGIAVTRNPEDGSFRFQFFSAGSVPDHMLDELDLEDGEDDQPEIDLGSGYTWAQLAQMRAEQEEKIYKLEMDIRMAEADYKLLEFETGDGNVYATVDGVVMTVLGEEEAKMTQQPIVKVSGGGGFYIECTISELEKEKLVIGQEVTVNDWNTGMTYTGYVDSTGDFPDPEGYFSGMGNPNVSYYPFLVFVDGTAQLQEGRYVSVMFSTSGSTNGIYLQNPFLRSEQGRSYVYVQGADGLLEKRYVTTGKALWGSYTEILEGITPEDNIAFPYGKEVKSGAPTVVSDLSELYG